MPPGTIEDQDIVELGLPGINNNTASRGEMEMAGPRVRKTIHGTSVFQTTWSCVPCDDCQRNKERERSQ
jgi:hypothetical protein